MTIANLGIAVQSGPAAAAAVDLDKLAASAKSAEAATDALGAESRETAVAIGQVSAAANVESAANTKVTATTRMHTAALQAETAALRLGNMQRGNLIFQLNDIGVSLASGMPAWLVLVQQGSQISTIYEGGVVPALRETAAMAGRAAAAFWPIGLAVGAAVAAVAGLTYEINKTAEVQVGFFDVALAGWQLFADGISSVVSPVWNGIVSGLQWVWDQSVPILKYLGNAIIAPWALGVKAIGTLWSGLPAAIGDVMITAANVIVKGVEWSINKAAELLDSFINKANEGLSQLPGGLSIPTTGRVDFGEQKNPYAGSLGRLGTQLYDDSVSANTTDYMGGMFDAISGRAQAIAGARKEVEGIGNAANAANDNVKKLADDGLSSAAKKATEFGDTLKSAFKGFIGDIRDGKSWIEALGNAVGDLGDKFLDLALDAVFGGSGAGGGGGIFGAIAGLFGFAKGGAFSGGVQAFANGGIVNKPTMFPMANGAGLMGEAGPEAIMPLRRGPDGRLGVAAANQNGGGMIYVQATMQVVNGNLVPIITEVSGEVAGQKVAQAAPSIVGASVAQANKSAPGALARYQQQEQGGDYRNG